MKEYNSVFIPGNVPSLKNSKIKTSKGIFPSKTVQKYLRSLGIKSFSSSRKTVKFYKTFPMTFPLDELKMLFKDAEYPIIIGLHFYRATKHSFDFNNANQIILDLFTAFDIIEDDNSDFVIPLTIKLNDKWYTYDKENPGVEVFLVKDYVLTF